MTYDALRKGRVSLPSQAYVVTTITDNRVPYFSDVCVGRLVAVEIRRLDNAGFVGTLAWVLMPDHLHWMFQLTGSANLSAVMKNFKGRSARAVNGYHGRTGAIWQRAFYDRAVRREEDIRGVARYLVGNPLRAGLVKSIGDYPLWDAVWL